MPQSVAISWDMGRAFSLSGHCRLQSWGKASGSYAEINLSKFGFFLSPVIGQRSAPPALVRAT
jgi:hypothetical protein